MLAAGAKLKNLNLSALLQVPECELVFFSPVFGKHFLSIPGHLILHLFQQRRLNHILLISLNNF